MDGSEQVGSPGIIAWALGNLQCGNILMSIVTSVNVEKPLYVTDGCPVYPCFIEDADHIVSKTYMTKVENEENTRLRHYLARLHRSSLCYSESVCGDAPIVHPSVAALFEAQNSSYSSLNHYTCGKAAISVVSLLIWSLSEQLKPMRPLSLVTI